MLFYVILVILTYTLNYLCFVLFHITSDND
jgi:hypothetical protein